ncbi:MAG TPA: hypothetical protein VKS21_02550, partial [Spirochaetota bacterium]|nr:hypothetical protein [Spirochaetota bacterium]
YKCRRGDIIGTYHEFEQMLPAVTSCRVKKGTLLFKLMRDDFRKFIKKNPGVYMRFFDALSKE